LIDGIKDILDNASPGVSRRIKVKIKGSLNLAELGDATGTVLPQPCAKIQHKTLSQITII